MRQDIWKIVYSIAFNQIDQIRGQKYSGLNLRSQWDDDRS